MGKQFFKLYKSMSSLARPLNNSIPDEDFFNEVNVLLKQMEDINKFILSPEVTFRLVLNPEKLSILETKRAYTFIHLYGINIDGIVINKILPTSSTVGEYFEFWSDLHTKYLMEIDNSFYPTPVFRCQLQRTEPLGPDALHEISKLVFGEQESDKIFYSGKNFWIESKTNAVTEDRRETLCIKVPFLKDAEDVKVDRMGTDIIVTVDRAQRIITLPRALYSLEMEKFIREDNILKVVFREVPSEKDNMELNVNKNVLDKLRSMRRLKI
jgi:arsenite-transporting ATPase